MIRFRENPARKYSGILVILICLYVTLFSAIAYFKYRSFSFQDIDLAIINQTFWNAARGRIVVDQFAGATIFNGGHVFLIALILVPVYFFAQSPLTLLFLQSLLLGLGAWPIYLIARDLLKPSGALVLAFSYLIYPALNYANLFEFHPVALATPLLLFMFLFYIRRRWGWFLLFMVLSLSCREDVSIPVFGFGVYGLFRAGRKPRGERSRELKWGLIPLLSGLIWFFFCIRFLQPTFLLPELTAASEEPAMFGSTYFAWLGDSPGEIMLAILTRPGQVLGEILSPVKLAYLKDLLIPLAFTSLFSPSRFLMVIISLSEGWLSQRFAHSSIRYQYASLATPFVFISAIYGVRNLFSWKVLAGKRKYVLGAVLVFALISAESIGPFFDILVGRWQWRVTAEDRIRQGLIELIPPRAPVIATCEFTPKLSLRPQLFYFYAIYAASRPDLMVSPAELKTAQEDSQWALIDFDDWMSFYVFYTPDGDKDIYRFLNDGNWQLIHTVNTIALFKKSFKADIELVSRGEEQAAGCQVNKTIIPQVEFSGYNLRQSQIFERKTIDTEIFFHCLAPISTNLLFNVRFTSRKKPGFSFAQVFAAPNLIYPSSRWQPGEEVKQRCNILIPEEAPEGEYEMTLAVLNFEGEEEAIAGRLFFGKSELLRAVSRKEGELFKEEVFYQEPMAIRLGGES